MSHLVKKQTPDQRAVVNELIHIRDCDRQISDRRFYDDYLADVPRFSYTVWFRVQNDNYTGDTDRVITALQDKLVFIRERIRADKNRERVEAGEDFYQTDSVIAALDAIEEASNRGDEIRLVVYLAPFGAGKSALGRHLKRKRNAVIVPVFNTWRSSYSAGLRGIGALSGVTGKFKSLEEHRNAVFCELRDNPRLLYFDDANTLGPQTLNLIRDILNHTPCIVVVAAIPELMDQLCKKSFWESGQTFSRAVAIIPAEHIKVDDVAHFLAPFKLNGVLKPACSAIKDAANEFGHFRFVRRVVEYCDAAGGREKQLDLDTILHGVRRTQALLRSGQIALAKRRPA